MGLGIVAATSANPYGYGTEIGLGFAGVGTILTFIAPGHVGAAGSLLQKVGGENNEEEDIEEEYIEKPSDTVFQRWPEDNETVNALSPKLEWQNINNANYYRVSVYYDQECKKPVISKTISFLSWKIPAGNLKRYKTYYWTVSANTSKGWISSSSVWSFNTK